MKGSIEFLRALRDICNKRQAGKITCGACPLNPECSAVLVRPDEAKDADILALVTKVGQETKRRKDAEIQK